MTTDDHFDIDAMIDAVYKSRRRRYISKENNLPFKESRSKTADNDDFHINNLFEVVYKKEVDDVKSSIQSKDDSMKFRRSLSSSKENNQQFRQRSKTPDNVDFHIENLLETTYKKEADDVKTSIQSKDDSLKSRLSYSSSKENNLQSRESKMRIPEKDDFHINKMIEAAYKNKIDDVKSQTKYDNIKSKRSRSSSKEDNLPFKESSSKIPRKDDFHNNNLLETAYKKEADDVKTSIQGKDDSIKSSLSRSRSKENNLQSRESKIRNPEKDEFDIKNLIEATNKKEADDIKTSIQSKDDSLKSRLSCSSSKENNIQSRESKIRTPEKDEFDIKNLIKATNKKEADDIKTSIQSKDDSLKSRLSCSSSKENNIQSRESKIRTPEKDEFDIKNLIEATNKKEADDIKTSIQSKDGSDKSCSSSKENHLQSTENRSTTPVKDEFDINSLIETVYENVINDVKSLIQSKNDSIKSSLSRSSSKENNLQPRESRSQTPEKDEFDINSKSPDNDEFDIDALLEAPYENETNDDKSLRQTKDYFLKLKQSDTRPKEHHEDPMQTICQIPARKRRFMEEIKQRSRSVTTDESQKSRNSEVSRKRYLPSRSMSPDCTREVIHYSSDELTMFSLPTEFGKKQTNQKASYEERDARTVFLMQLPRNISTRDMKEFFSTVGQVRNFRMVSDRNSRKSKGIGYVEFTDTSAVTPALALSGQRLYGVPILVLPTMAEKNRLAAKQAAIGAKGAKGPLKLYVGSLDYNITESMLRAIFEPFGVIQSAEIQYDPETNQSRGYGFVNFADSAAAKRAMAQMDGFEVAGRPMKVNATYYDSLDGSSSILDDDREEKGGIEMNAQSRTYLMQKLAQTYCPDFNIPSTPVVPAVLQTPLREMGKSTCLVLSNLFDPNKETDPEWDMEYRDDVLEEVAKLGMIVHIAVDKFSHEGNVYLKCLTSDVAAKVIKSFDGRWYAGRTIRAVPIPFTNYSAMFPVSANAVRPIKPGERKETDPEWDMEYRDDVLEEVAKLGMIVHIAVDKFSHEGNVFLKCLTSDVASKVIKSFDGRWYGGRTIRAVPIPFTNYSAMFPVSANAVRPIKPEER